MNERPIRTKKTPTTLTLSLRYVPPPEWRRGSHRSPVRQEGNENARASNAGGVVAVGIRHDDDGRTGWNRGATVPRRRDPASSLRGWMECTKRTTRRSGIDARNEAARSHPPFRHTPAARRPGTLDDGAIHHSTDPHEGRERRRRSTHVA